MNPNQTQVLTRYKAQKKRGASSIPSHVTPGQAALILDVSPQAIEGRIKRGTLPTESWYGRVMIQMGAVLEILERKGRPQ